MKRWIVLKAMQAKGAIQYLRRQEPYKIKVNGWMVCTYIADFWYQDEEGRTVVEDCKGVRTPEYRIKAKLMWACFGVSILET